MSQLEAIKKEIIEDAEKEAENLINKVREEKEKKKEAALEKTEQEAQQMLARAEKEAPAIKERAEAAAERQAANIILRAKQDLIDRIFRLTEEKLINMSDEDYSRLLEKALSSKSWPKDAVVEIVKGRKIPNLPYKFQEHEDIKSGFRVSYGGVRDNFDYVELLHYQRADLSASLIKRLEEELKR